MALLRLQFAEFSPPLEGNQLVLSVGETQTVAAKVVVEDCSHCRVDLIASAEHFSLIMGEKDTEIGGGTFDRKLEWQLQAIAPGDHLSIQVEATADEKYQTTMVSVRIHPRLRIED